MAKYSAEDLRRLGAKGHAFKNPDGSYSYPIDDADDLDKAIHAVGRGGASHDAIRRYIIRRAKALGLASKIPDNWGGDGSMRAQQFDARTLFTRCVLLDDIRIRSAGQGGDGRTVEAYAAVFNTPSEVQDQDGHYQERNAPTAFAKTLAEKGQHFPVFYSHGRSIDGFPSDLFSLPLGRTTSIVADGKGLLTVSQYNRGELADQVLESIRNGDITGMSYSGLYVKSTPSRPPRGGYRATSG